MKNIINTNLLSVILAYFGSRIFFSLIGFDYDIFEESFSLIKLAIDLGVFVVLFSLFHWLLSKAFK